MEMRRLKELERNKLNNEQFERNPYDKYENRDFPNENEIRQRNYHEPNIKNNNYNPNEDFQREYNEYLNKDYNRGLREPNNINVRD